MFCMKTMVKSFNLLLIPLLFVGAGCVPANSNDQNTPAGWSTYRSPHFGFEIAAPPSSDIQSNTNAQASFGRRGGVVINDVSSSGTKTVVINVYDSQDHLEKDHQNQHTTSLDEAMAELGLDRVADMEVAGEPRVVYAGEHVVDGVGGTPYRSVWIEVIGTAYAYAVSFQNFSEDPLDLDIQNYLNSLKLI